MKELRNILVGIKDMIENTINWLIEKLESVRDAMNRLEDRKRRIKINKLMLELYRLDVLRKIKTEDCDYIKRFYERRDKKVMWIVEYDGEYLNDQNYIK